MKCQGMCSLEGTCSGEVKAVSVKFGAKDWGMFFYCDTAIETDREHGFTVTGAELAKLEEEKE